MSLNGVKNVEKSIEKIWKFHFFAVTLHPLSGRKLRLKIPESRVLKGKNKGSEKIFEKSF